MFKILENGTAPTRGTKHSACVDLYASEDVIIEAGETCVIGLGITIDIDKLIEHEFANIKYEPYYQDHIDGFLSSHYLQLMLRSSLGKKGLILPNGIGVIDLDYTGEIKMIIHNPMKTDTLCGYMDGTVGVDLDNNHEAHIKKGDKIAQITLLEHKSYLMNIYSDITRAGGFGSTGE